MKWLCKQEDKYILANLNLLNKKNVQKLNTDWKCLKQMLLVWVQSGETSHNYLNRKSLLKESLIIRGNCSNERYTKY